MLAQLGRRIVDDTLQGRLLVAAVALMTLETLKEKTLPRKEETDKDSPTDHLPATKSWVRSHSLQEAFYGMPFPLLESSTRVECEALRIPNRYTRIRRHQTLAKMQDSATKATLTSKYEVQWGEFLGEGAFGQVFLAKDRKTGEAVAVKKMPQNMTDNVSFQREMDALLRLRDEGGHPHICGLRENYEEDEHYYLVLDLVSGGEMFDHLCEKGAYSEADAARLVREVASALSFMHGIGIVHGE
jgi:predicted Ser/Thr protein kinase